MADSPTPDAVAPAPVDDPLAVCLRCGQHRPVGENGFCSDCEKAMEQACL